MVENRWADGHPDRLSGLAAELVRLDPRIIVCYGSEATRAAKQATASIPVIMAVSADPIGAGLAASLARPGGNVTGLSMAQPDMAGKYVQLIKTLVPQAQRIAVLINPHDPTYPNRSEEVIRAAGSIGVEGFSVAAAAVEQIAGAFAEMTSHDAHALIVLGTPLFTQAGVEIVELAARQRLPALYDTSSFIAIGGLISYGADPNDLFRRAAYYVDRILKGTKPADLPILLPTNFDLARASFISGPRLIRGPVVGLVGGIATPTIEGVVEQHPGFELLQIVRIHARQAQGCREQAGSLRRQLRPRGVGTTNHGRQVKQGRSS